MTFDTFDQSDEQTWPDQKKTMTIDKDKCNDKDKDKYKDKDNDWESTFREHLQRAILETFDLWDIWSEWWGDMTWSKTKDKDIDHDKRMTWLVYLCEIVDISDSWEPEFMTIIVTWQLRVTLDSIRNSCDVCTDY